MSLTFEGTCTHVIIYLMQTYVYTSSNQEPDIQMLKQQPVTIIEFSRTNWAQNFWLVLKVPVLGPLAWCTCVTGSTVLHCSEYCHMMDATVSYCSGF